MHSTTKYILLSGLLSLHLSAPAQADAGYWRDKTGTPLAETESTKSQNGFAASLLVTTDEDWRRKWDTPPSNNPVFTKADVVPYGKQVFILSFFSNPKLDPSGNAEIRCDLKIVNPAGEVAQTLKDMSCFSGLLKTNPYYLYLSEPVIGFSGDPGDPAGIWSVEMVLKDTVRGTELPLRATFSLK